MLCIINLIVVSWYLNFCTFFMTSITKHDFETTAVFFVRLLLQGELAKLVPLVFGFKLF